MDYANLPPELISILAMSSRPKKKKKKAKKKKPNHWYETCSAAELQQLCRASKLPVSGTKAVLVQRLLSNDTTKEYGSYSVAHLQQCLQQELLVKSGKNKCTLLLRLLRHKFGTGGPAETSPKPTTPRAKPIFKPKSLYDRVQKKIHSVQQAKYQTHYGSKGHAPDTYEFIKKLLQEQCLDNHMAHNNPVLALDMACAMFLAFADHFPYMERPGYGSRDFGTETMGALEDVLFEVVKSSLPQDKVKKMVDVLERLNGTVRGYGLEEKIVYKRDLGLQHLSRQERKQLRSHKWDADDFKIVETRNCFVDAIRILQPDYDERKMKEHGCKPLYRDLRGIAALNGISYTVPDMPTFQE